MACEPKMLEATPVSNVVNIPFLELVGSSRVSRTQANDGMPTRTGCENKGIRVGSITRLPEGTLTRR